MLILSNKHIKILTIVSFLKLFFFESLCANELPRNFEVENNIRLGMSFSDVSRRMPRLQVSNERVFVLNENGSEYFFVRGSETIYLGFCNSILSSYAVRSMGRFERYLELLYERLRFFGRGEIDLLRIGTTYLIFITWTQTNNFIWLSFSYLNNNIELAYFSRFFNHNCFIQ